MKRLAAVLAASAVAGVALAGDPPAKTDVEIKLAAKAGDTFRFRQTESSSMEVGGRAMRGSEVTQEYSVTVKQVRKDGGADVEVTLDSMRARLYAAMTDSWTTIDTSLPPPENADQRTQT